MGAPARSAGKATRLAVAATLAWTMGSGIAAAQQDILAIPKNSKPLDWDWYARKDSREVNFNRFSGLSPDYRLGAGDELQIQIVGFTGPYNFRIRSGGDIVVPQLGPLHVAGLTAEEAETLIASQFKERQLLVDPEVLVYIYSYEAKKFYVYGQIDRPGEYTMSQQLTVMDGILMGGGLDFYGARYGYLHRRNPTTTTTVSADRVVATPEIAQPGHTVTRFDLEPMRNGGMLEPNPTLQEGDVIVIPTRYPMLFYVLGDVVSPGYFQLPTDERMTVSRAISHAGGTTRTAKASKGVVIRYTPDGTRQEMRVDYKALLEGRQPDFELLSGDIVFIPGSGAKTVGMGLLGQLPQLVQTSPVTR